MDDLQVNMRKLVSCSSEIRPPRDAPIRTFDDYISSLPGWEYDILRHIRLIDDLFTMAVVISHGIRAVSDGSEWYGTQGSFGWSMSDDKGRRVVTGQGPVSGSILLAMAFSSNSVRHMDNYAIRIVTSDA